MRARVIAETYWFVAESQAFMIIESVGSVMASVVSEQPER